MAPAARDSCRRRIAGFRSEGIFAPPSLEGAVAFPGFGGGMHWGSLSHDPVRGLVIVNTTRLAFMVRLIPRAAYQQMRQHARANGLLGEFPPQLRTPHAMYPEPLLSPSAPPA